MEQALVEVPDIHMVAEVRVWGSVDAHAVILEQDMAMVVVVEMYISMPVRLAKAVTDHRGL
jgi:hypothetical protein